MFPEEAREHFQKECALACNDDFMAIDRKLVAIENDFNFLELAKEANEIREIQRRLNRMKRELITCCSQYFVP